MGTFIKSLPTPRPRNIDIAIDIDARDKSDLLDSYSDAIYRPTSSISHLREENRDGPRIKINLYIAYYFDPHSSLKSGPLSWNLDPNSCWDLGPDSRKLDSAMVKEDTESGMRKRLSPLEYVDLLDIYI